jgi:transcriptional regulator with XRE-family HTH domain
MQGLGKRIKELRKSKKMTLVEIAKKTGIDQATLSRMENGKMTGTLDSHMRLALEAVRADCRGQSASGPLARC